MRDVNRLLISRSSCVMEPTRDSSSSTRRELILSALTCSPKTESWPSEEPREEIWRDLSSPVEEVPWTVLTVWPKRILDLLSLSMSTNWERRSTPLLRDARTPNPAPYWLRDRMNTPSLKLRKQLETDWELSRIPSLTSLSFQEVELLKLLPILTSRNSRPPFLERPSSELMLSLRVCLLFRRFWLRILATMSRTLFWNWLMSMKRIMPLSELTVSAKRPTSKRSVLQSPSESGTTTSLKNNGCTLPQLSLNNCSSLMRSWELERIWEEDDDFEKKKKT